MFKEKLRIDEFMLVDWKKEIAYSLTIKDCAVIAKEAINHKLDGKAFILPIIREVRAFRDTGGDVITEPYTIICEEDKDEHNGCMVYYNYGYNDWDTMKEEDFEFLINYIKKVLR